jgi:hypothetical protein
MGGCQRPKDDHVSQQAQCSCKGRPSKLDPSLKENLCTLRPHKIYFQKARQVSQR